MAPEVWRNTACGYNGKNTDVWCMGIVLVVLISGKFPWSMPDLRDNDFLAYTQGQMPFPVHLSAVLTHLLRITLASANRRVTSNHNIIGHAWFSVPCAKRKQAQSPSSLQVYTADSSEPQPEMQMSKRFRTDTEETPHVCRRYRCQWFKPITFSFSHTFMGFCQKW